MTVSRATQEYLLLERLAALEHDQWRFGFAKPLLESEPGLSDRRKSRWPHLIKRKYDELTDAEKEQDREWARKVIGILNEQGWEPLDDGGDDFDGPGAFSDPGGEEGA